LALTEQACSCNVKAHGGHDQRSNLLILRVAMTEAEGWRAADAHPFSYMLDHKKESVRFDPDGNFVRRWLPVLARMPVMYIHRWGPSFSITVR